MKINFRILVLQAFIILISEVRSKHNPRALQDHLKKIDEWERNCALYIRQERLQ